MKATIKPIANHAFVLLALIGVVLLMFLSPFAQALTLQQTLSACLILGAIILFASSAIPEHLTALLFMTGAMLLSLAPASVVFSGFYSTACWLIFAGLVIGIALQNTGLAQSLSSLISQSVTTHYGRVITTVVCLSTLLGFLMPSSLGRAVILVPLAMAIAKQCGFDSSRPGYTGIALAVAFGCHVPTFAVLPANVPNMVMIGAAETIYGWAPGYMHYLLLHFPVLGLLKILLIIVTILWLYPDKTAGTPYDAPTQSYSRDQKSLMIILVITLGFWISDSWHHISAAWIGLTTACILLLPKIGLVDKQSFDANFTFSPLIFVAGFLSLGAVVNHSGLGSILGDTLIRILPFKEGHEFSNFILLGLSATVTGIVTTLPGVGAVLTPFAESISQQTGMSIQAVIMTQVLGFSTIVFPFQSAPLVVAMQLAGVSLKHAAKLCLLLTLLTLFILFPLDYFWWVLIGEI